MTLDGHIKTGLAMALAWTATASSIYPGIENSLTLLVAMTIFIGNLAPDFLEFKVIPHRTFTHFPWFYIILAGVGYAGTHEVGTLTLQAGFLDITTGMAMLGFAFGCLSHTFCDWPYYGGIPLFRPTKKVRLFNIEFEQKANRLIEHTVLLCWLSFLFLPLIPDGTFSPESISGVLTEAQDLFSDSKETIETIDPSTFN